MTAKQIERWETEALYLPRWEDQKRAVYRLANEIRRLCHIPVVRHPSKKPKCHHQ